MGKPDFSELKAIFVNCTLKKSDRMSHTRGLINLSKQIMDREGAQTEVIRMVDHEIAPGVYPDMTEYGQEVDKWPELFEQLIAADILIIGSPIWLGEPTSEARKLVERLYAMSGQYNDKGQYRYYGKVGGCILTGNEDGAKHCAMSLLYSLQHIGYSIPPQADCGWLGEIGPGPSYLDESSGGPENEFTNRNTTFMTYNLMQLALMLKQSGGYPSYGNSAEAWNDGEHWGFRQVP